MSGKIEDPAVLLAAVRATGGLASQRADPRTVDAARRAADDAGRALLTYRADDTGGRGLVLGWISQYTPAPEDSLAYPVRRLSPVAVLTWASCLGLAWPDRAAPPYPGEPFTRSGLLEVTGDLGLSTMWVKSALYRVLIPARLVEARSTVLHLGPATAALPEPFVEAMRRFHDRLPRLDLRRISDPDLDIDEADLDGLGNDDGGDDSSDLDDETFEDDTLPPLPGDDVADDL
ncbi:hypothetical protein [Actinoplanes missouriensis]|uniref:hypothetical protein n=1 Tax=Actinoplanes missouriensis TaxID=1866 RepID=UPI0036C72B75